MSTINEVVIDGIHYVPYSEIKVTVDMTMVEKTAEPDAYDCDGTPLRIGDRIKVRMSAFKLPPFMHPNGLNKLNRYGTFRGLSSSNSIGMEFDAIQGHDLQGAIDAYRGWYYNRKYIRKDATTAPPVTAVECREDCDGNPVHIGDRVKVRLSALHRGDQALIEGLNESNRYATVENLGLNHYLNMFKIRFDDPVLPQSWIIPAEDIRLA